MSPLEFATWLKKFMNDRHTVSAIDIMTIKHTLANVVTEPVTPPKAKSGSQYFAPGVVFDNPNLDGK